MAKMFNAYQAATPIGQSLSQLAASFFSGPSKHEQELAQAKYDNLTASTQASQYGAALDADKLSAYQSLPEVYGAAMAGDDPAASMRATMPQLMGTLTRTGDTGQIADLILTMMANSGASDQATARAMVGSGQPIGQDDYMSLADREYGRNRNAALDPLSESEQKARMVADVFNQWNPMQQNAYMGALPSKSEVEGNMLQGMAPGLSPTQARTAVGAQPGRSQVEGAALEQAYPNMNGRDQATILGTLNAPSIDYQQLPGGASVGLDTNNPQAIANPVPMRQAGPDGGTQLGPVSLQGAPGSQDDGMTATMQNTRDRAQQLGISPNELEFLTRVDAYRNSAGGMAARLPPETEQAYNAIMEKIRQSMPAQSQGGIR